MDDINKPKDELPPDVDEVVDLFFGDDDSTPIDFGKGRPSKKEVDKKTKPTPKKETPKIDKDEESFLEKQIKLLKRFEKRQESLDNRQKKFDKKLELKNEEKERIRNLLRSEKNKKHRIPRASHLAKQREFNNVLYADRGVIHTTSCDHIDRVYFVKGTTIVTVCEKCSRYKDWEQEEWIFYNERRHKDNK